MKPAVINIQGALARLEGDHELFQELCLEFHGDMASRLDQLSSALSAQNAPVLKRHAHSIKSAAAAIGAEEIHLLAARLESADPTRDAALAEELVAALNAAFLTLQSTAEFSSATTPDH